MSLLDSDLDLALQDMEQLQADDTGLPPQFTFAGLTWPCTRNTLKRGDAYEVGGKMVIYDFSIRVRLEALDSTGAQLFRAAPQPVSGDTIQMDTRYRVEFVDRAHGAFLTLLLTFDGK